MKLRDLALAWAWRYDVVNNQAAPNYGGSELRIITPLFAVMIWIWRKDFTVPVVNSGFHVLLWPVKGSRELGWIEYKFAAKWKTPGAWNLDAA